MKSSQSGCGQADEAALLDDVVQVAPATVPEKQRASCCSAAVAFSSAQVFRYSLRDSG